MGHEVFKCKRKNQQQKVEAKVVDQEEEDQLFVANCFLSSKPRKCQQTNHMTFDKALFRYLKQENVNKS